MSDVKFDQSLTPWPGIRQQHINEKAGRQSRLPGVVAPPGLIMPPTASGPALSQNTVVDMARFATLNGTKFVSVGTTSVLAVSAPAANTARNSLMIRNPNAVAVLYVDFGQSATANSVVSLQPGEIMLFDAVVPQDDVYVLSDTAASVASLAWSSFALPVS